MVYFDNAATTYPKPESVYAFMDKFYRECGVNVGRGQHDMTNKASKLYSETKQLVKELLNCHDKEVVFTTSATESLNIILQGIRWDDNYTVYVSPFEHNSVMRVIYHLQNIYKIHIKQLTVNKETLTYDLEKIKYDFQDAKPNVVVMSHASNVCGLIAPIKEICDLAKEHDAITVVDMAQTAGLIPTDLSQIKADYVVFAGHKTLYGSFGVGGLILDSKSKLEPLMYGGSGIDSLSHTMPETVPERYESGSRNIQAVAGLNAALKWILEQGVESIYQKEKEYTTKLVDIIKGYSNIKLVGYKDDESNIGVVSCLFDGYSSDNIGQVLNEQEIAVRTGLHCSPIAHEFFGTSPEGTVRFSIGYFNTDEDLEKLQDALDYIEFNG
ncbi:MAG: aminotransferase class V-fold PLP-dependent enzyme [Clostridia bacterium]|nr:aminotransferase class V-fold PLP-dependent enzyme [Clostridia bacterium]